MSQSSRSISFIISISVIYEDSEEIMDLIAVRVISVFISFRFNLFHDAKVNHGCAKIQHK